MTNKYQENNWPDGLRMNHPNLVKKLHNGYKLDGEYFLEDVLTDEKLIDHHKSKGALTVLLYINKHKPTDYAIFRGWRKFRSDKGEEHKCMTDLYQTFLSDGTQSEIHKFSYPTN